METQHTTEETTTTTTTTVIEKAPHHSNDKILMGILSYLGPLVIIPYLMKKEDPFVKFHIRQGLVLLSIEVILWILTSVLFVWSFWPIYRIINAAIVILSILGIINAVQDKMKELPIVGGWAKNFNI